ncbi:MAG: crotonase/enoyl-CoA hydratase family protein [Chromatiales bacterium]|nr:crotonase/enoyl-CoA hydratase family protein [Chromatiales bacterium]
MSDRVRVDREGPVALVCLTRAQQHNGMDFRMLDAVRRAARLLRKDRQVRAVIIHGEGPSFCAGLDVKSVLGNPGSAAVGLASLFSPGRNRFQEWSMAWREVPAPVIAAIHGNCFGAGLQLALGADIRLATPDARLAVMEVKWGLVPDMGGAALLRELVPIDVAKELAMTGRIVSGTEAHALKLVTRVTEAPLEQARALAAEIATRSPDAVAAAKFLLQASWHAGEAEALAAERQWQRRVIGGRNQRIAVRRNAPRSPEQPELPFVPRRIGS